MYHIRWRTKSAAPLLESQNRDFASHFFSLMCQFINCCKKQEAITMKLEKV